MKTFKQFLSEASNQWDSNRVYRVDPVDRDPEAGWKASDYAILKNKSQITGSAPLSGDHNVKPGDKLGQATVDRTEKVAFATPNMPNAFYGVAGRKAGPGGTPAPGAAVFDENKMFGPNRVPGYKGTLHTTQDVLDKMPTHVTVSSAHGDGWKTEDYSGKEEVTSSKPARDIQSQKVKLSDLLHQQYNVVVHPNVDSIKKAISKVPKGMSVLDQTDGK